MSRMRFDNQTVVITNAGHGLGRAYAVFFGSRGANVVVNQCREGPFAGPKSILNQDADTVVDEISRSGGVACSNYDSVLDGEKIIETALARYGGIHILINNEPFNPKFTMEQVTDNIWDSYMELRLNGPYKCTRAAWIHFKAQSYGRIINTSSYAGLYGSANHVCESAGGLAQVGFTESLAKEGKRNNILVNVVAPISLDHEGSLRRSDQTASDMFDHASIVPLVAVLLHVSNKTESGSIFEVRGRHIAKLRWERARGLLLHPKLSLTPEAIMKDWLAVNDFSIPTHPDGPANFKKVFEEAQSLKGITTPKSIRFDRKVALVTGAGGGLGRQYAHFLAARGASIVVNDLNNVEIVVNEIKKMGGNAVGIQASVENGEVLVKAAIDAYGRIDILINNAGFLRDKGFANMDEERWNSVIAVHLRGAYKVTKAAWPYFLKQKYGRVVNTSSTSGIYGYFGQTNYSTAKIALVGFSRALALEGAKSNIRVNAIAPVAGTPVGELVAPELLSAAFEPSFNAPMVELLCSDSGLPHSTGELFEVGCGWQARTRWQRSGGFTFPTQTNILPETVLDMWSRIVDFDDGHCDYPGTFEQTAMLAQSKFANGTPTEKSLNAQFLANIEERKNAKMESVEFGYTEKDVLLYNIAVGARRVDQQLIFEGSTNFQALPTFGVIPMFPANIFFDMEGIVPNFSLSKLLHAEHYLEILKFPLPTAARLVTKPRLIEVIDKGKSAIAISAYTTIDSTTGEAIFYNEISGFIRGGGNFGGQSAPSNRGRASASYPPPSRVADAIVEQKTSEEQAALYRLTGDMTPIHVDSAASMNSGFKTPILHGLCTLGFAGQHIFREFGQFKNIKARFVGTVTPGQSLRTSMWKEDKFVIFQTTVVETGKLCIALAGAELVSGTTRGLSSL